MVTFPKSLLLVSVFMFLILFTAMAWQNGKTTRYWDCCKPSCAWPGKARVTHPVATCSKNGSRLSDGTKTVSGCDGGSAFACAAQGPWNVSRDVSYGFAAARIQGQGEKNWCCRCYQLNFTTPPIQGKRMIVQVTNTGWDLSNNHFDIAIPGAGEGIFQGCKSQYGTLNGSWGERYGGIGTATHCLKLPKQLQKGCAWRFSWFKNADNPNVIFQQVKCPSVIVQLTGCQRLEQ